MSAAVGRAAGAGLAAAERTWDVVVVGAGPAGALAARQLARRGLAVLLVDRQRFPRAKVCGACLNRRSLELLERAGLGGRAAAWGGVPLGELRLAAGGRRARIPLPTGLALSRARFDAGLAAEAAAAGVVFLDGCSARLESAAGRRGAAGERTDRGTDAAPPFVASRPAPSELSTPEDEGLEVRLERGAEAWSVWARVVVAADGLAGSLVPGAARRSRVSPDSRVGVAATMPAATPGFERGAIHMAVGRRGYAGLVRIEDGSLHVAAALDPAAVRGAGGPAAAVAAVVREAGFGELPGLAAAAWKGTPELTRRPARLASPRLFRIGDAAGYVEPFTGEGIAWALETALAVAPLAAAGAAGWSAALERRWRAIHARGPRRRQRSCRTVARGLRRPGLVAAAVAALGWAPALAAPVVGRVNAAVRGVSA